MILQWSEWFGYNIEWLKFALAPCCIFIKSGYQVILISAFVIFCCKSQHYLITWVYEYAQQWLQLGIHDMTRLQVWVYLVRRHDHTLAERQSDGSHHLFLVGKINIHAKNLQRKPQCQQPATYRFNTQCISKTIILYCSLQFTYFVSP